MAARLVNTLDCSRRCPIPAAPSKPTLVRPRDQLCRPLAVFSGPDLVLLFSPTQVLGTCVFALAYIGVRFYQAKDMLDVSFLASRHGEPTISAAVSAWPMLTFSFTSPLVESEIPWKDQPVSDGRNLTSVYARGDGIET